jgi:hypothetical protein
MITGAFVGSGAVRASWTVEGSATPISTTASVNVVAAGVVVAPPPWTIADLEVGQTRVLNPPSFVPAGVTITYSIVAPDTGVFTLSDGVITGAVVGSGQVRASWTVSGTAASATGTVNVVDAGDVVAPLTWTVPDLEVFQNRALILPPSFAAPDAIITYSIVTPDTGVFTLSNGWITGAAVGSGQVRASWTVNNIIEMFAVGTVNVVQS